MSEIEHHDDGTRQQFPSGWHLQDRSAVGSRRHASRRAADPIMKNARGFSQLFVNEKGTAAIEFGLVGTMLSLLLLGVVDFGMGYWEQIQVGNAARAGAEYAIFNGWNQSGIATAVTNATSLSSIAATPASTQSFGCPSATGGITAAASGASCTGGGTAGSYVTVNAKASYTTLFTYPGVTNPLTLTARVTVRID
jgi:Flp pilus assembly protein TadG